MVDSDDVINNFFNNNYSTETTELLFRGIGLFVVFNHLEPVGDIVDLISLVGSMEKDNVVDGVRNIIEKGCDELLKGNRVNVSSDANFSQRLDILEAIFALTKVEDPTDLLPLLEGWLSNEEKLARVLGVVMGVPYEDYLVNLLWVYEGTITRMKEYFKTIQVENETLDFELLKVIRTNLATFEKAFGTPPVVESLIEINPIKGESFELYEKLFKEEIVDSEDIESIAYGYLYLTLLSKEGCSNPAEILVGRSREMFTELSSQQKFENIIVQLLDVFIKTKENRA